MRDSVSNGAILPLTASCRPLARPSWNREVRRTYTGEAVHQAPQQTQKAKNKTYCLQGALRVQRCCRLGDLLVLDLLVSGGGFGMSANEDERPIIGVRDAYAS